MARRRRRYFTRPRRSYFRRFRRRGGSKTIPIIPTVTGIMPALNAFQKTGGVNGISQNPFEFGRQMLFEYTGFDVGPSGEYGLGSWHGEIMLRNVGMWVGGYLAHMVANKIGVNRGIKRIPLVGKYISL